MNRLLNLDAARGFALLGIFCVNAAFFMFPLGLAMTHEPPPGLTTLDTVSWWFVQLFCMGKFFPLFSFMFGCGLMLMLDNVKRRGGNWVGVGLRRLFFLMVVGIMHGVLIWWGDILLSYSLLGLILLACSKMRARTLATIGPCLLLVSVFTGAGLGLLTQSDATPPARSIVDQYKLRSDASAFEQWLQGFEPKSVPVDPNNPDGAKKEISEMEQGPSSPLWIAAETAAMRDGPFIESTKFRALNVSFSLIITILVMGWQILGMFMLGAAAAKSGWLTDAYANARRRYAYIVLPICLVLSTAFYVGHVYLHSKLTMMLLSGILPVISAAAAVGYLCLIEQIALALPSIGRVLANTGRMAFTNYLMQSVIMTGVMNHWGLAKFGSLPHSYVLGLVFVIFAGQMILSTLWLKYFSMGPLEYVWRSVTYLGKRPA